MATPVLALQKALQTLAATGPKGFEGFARDLLIAATGHRFHLLKSGPQAGVDAMTEPLANGLVIGFEGKRYGAATRLGLDELKAKLIDAARSHIGLDLWVLATTRPIDASDRRALHALGDEEGVAVDVLDWDNHPAQLPALAVLWAAAPYVTKDYFSESENLEQALSELRADPRFSGELDRQLQNLKRPDIGFDNARRHSIGYLEGILQDRQSAKAQLRSPANLLEASAKRVRRRVESTIQNWWDQKRANPLVILGDEGVGKTWALLSWWISFVDGKEVAEIPLTLVVAAQDIGEHSGASLIVDRLARLVQLRSHNFWERRLVQWKEHRTPFPKILLIIDGLNQHFSYRRWSDLLQPLLARQWTGQVAVAITCRPDHWQNQLLELADLQPHPHIVTLGPFDGPELDEVLSLNGLTQNDLSPALLDLIRIPRLCQLAIERREEMEESGDITRWRLILEDWKHRLSIRGTDIGITDKEFRSLVSRLGSKLRIEAPSDSSVSRREIIQPILDESLRPPESLMGVISEVVDGRWLEPTSRAHRFKVRAELAPFALAIALIDHLTAAREGRAYEDEFAYFFDPLKGQDNGAEILRAAVTIGLLDDSCGHPLRIFLLRKWLNEQNLTDEDFDTFWRLIGSAPDIFLDFAESMWLEHSTGLPDEMLIDALARACEQRPVLEAVASRATRWLAKYRTDPLAWMFGGRDPDPPRSERVKVETIRRRKLWDEIDSNPFASIPLSEAESDDFHWVGTRVVAVLSRLPRLPFVPALTSWAVSRSIMAWELEYDEVAWLLRLNDQDAADVARALLDVCNQLIAIPSIVCQDAARMLLECLATPPAATRVRSLPVRQRYGFRRRSTISVDDLTNIIVWNHRSALSAPRSKDLPLAAATDLQYEASDPSLNLSKDDRTILVELVTRSDPSRFWLHHGGRTSEDHTLEDAAPALWRWAPAAYADFIRSIFSSATNRSPEQLKGLAYRLPEYVFLMDDEQLLLLERTVDVDQAISSQDASGQRELFPWINLRLGQIWKKSSSAQIAAMTRWPSGPQLLRDWDAILPPPKSSDFADISKRLEQSTSTEELTSWLGYLTVIDLSEMPQGFPILLSLSEHPDSNVRALALQVIYQSEDRSLWEQIRHGSWQACPEESSSASASSARDRENGYGSLILAEGATGEENESLVARVHNEALGILSINPNVRRDWGDAFAQSVQQDIAYALGQPSSHRISSLSLNDRKAYDKLVQWRGDDVSEWVRPLLTSSKSLVRGFSVREAHLTDLCRSFLKFRPEEGAILWRHLSYALDRSGVRDEELRLLPIKAPDHAAILDLRQLVLEQATNDLHLWWIATAATAHDRVDWLIASIRRDLAATSAGKIARALTLAGMLDNEMKERELWSGELVSWYPPSGWLSRVYNLAAWRFDRNAHARHWLNAFISERERDLAFGHFALFRSCADRRTLHWGGRLFGHVKSGLPDAWKAHWRLIWPDLRSACDREDDKLKGTLFGTKVGTSIQAPWN